MGIRSCSRICLIDSYLLQHRHIFSKKCLFRAYYTAASALSSEVDHVFDECPKPKLEVNVTDEVSVFTSIWKEPKLFPLVGRVFKSLNWMVAREIRFSTAVGKHGFAHATNAFRMVVHIFALCGMRREEIGRASCRERV